MTNLIANPAIGMIFLVPGMDETLRINGTAKITNDARLLEASVIQGRAQKVGLFIKIKEVFMHCPKAFIRSKLWVSSAQIDRSLLPSYAAILLDHCSDLTQEENDRQSKIMSERGLY